MFTANPETKELFSQFQSLGTADEMRVSEKFQEHGEKVTGEKGKKNVKTFTQAEIFNTKC